MTRIQVSSANSKVWESLLISFVKSLMYILNSKSPRTEPCERHRQPGHYSSLTAPNLQHTANQEQNNQCGNQHYSRELLMMGIVMPETC